MEMKGPFYNLKKAAEYCGYSASRFAKLLKGYELPMAGPNLNRYAEPILDLWMFNPETFKPQPQRRSHKQHKVQV